MLRWQWHQLDSPFLSGCRQTSSSLDWLQASDDTQSTVSAWICQCYNGTLMKLVKCANEVSCLMLSVQIVNSLWSLTFDCINCSLVECLWIKQNFQQTKTNVFNRLFAVHCRHFWHVVLLIYVVIQQYLLTVNSL